MSTRPVSQKDHWHLLYYLLAAFDVVTIIASLILNHTLLDIYTHSLDLNEQWVQRIGRYEQIATEMALVNAPGNDIFDSQDVAGETVRFEKALAGFRHIMQAVEQETGSISDPSQRAVILTDLKKIDTAMDEMAAEANLIFSYFRKGDAVKAGTRMATMDRKYAVLNQQMLQIRTRLRTFQSDTLVQERDKANDLSKFEYGFAGLVFFIICFVTFYGYQMSRRVLRSREIIQAQQVQIQTSAKMSALGEMAGGVAHEINNPLAVIKMRAEQLKEMIEEGDLDRAQLIDAVDTIEKTCARAAKIIKGLRTFARDGRSDPFQQESVQIIIEDTLALCSEKLAHRNINLQINAPTTEIRVPCRATEISQVLLNLISNATDAIEGHENAWIKLVVEDKSAYVEISVSDSGSGIPLEIRNKITQPFFTTKEVGKGTGLGLSIAKGIIESHEGSFDLDSTSANTRFVILLPKERHQQVA